MFILQHILIANPLPQFTKVTLSWGDMALLENFEININRYNKSMIFFYALGESWGRKVVLNLFESDFESIHHPVFVKHLNLPL